MMILASFGPLQNLDLEGLMMTGIVYMGGIVALALAAFIAYLICKKALRFFAHSYAGDLSFSEWNKLDSADRKLKRDREAAAIIEHDLKIERDLQIKEDRAYQRRINSTKWEDLSSADQDRFLSQEERDWREYSGLTQWQEMNTEHEMQRAQEQDTRREIDRQIRASVPDRRVRKLRETAAKFERQESFQALQDDWAAEREYLDLKPKPKRQWVGPRTSGRKRWKKTGSRGGSASDVPF